MAGKLVSYEVGDFLQIGSPLNGTAERNSRQGIDPGLGADSLHCH